MSRLPEKGEALASAEAMNARMATVHDGPPGSTFDLGGDVEVSRATGEARGLEFAIHAVYSDLFDIGETVATSASMCDMFIVDIALGRRDPMSALVSLFLMAKGNGVLEERARWTR
jgi:hypothetical protein